MDVDGGLADGGGEDPADDAVLDFFVAEHGVEDVGRLDVGEGGGEADGGEEVVLAICVGLRPAAGACGEAAGADHADGDGLAVPISAVAGGGLDGVGDGVAVVEDGADAAVLGILVHDAGLPAHAALDEFGEERGIVQPVGRRLDQVEQAGVEDDGGLDDFGVVGDELGARQRGQHVGIDDDALRG